MHMEPEDHRKLFLRFLLYMLIVIIVFFIEGIFIRTDFITFTVTVILGLHYFYKGLRSVKF